MLKIDLLSLDEVLVTLSPAYAANRRVFVTSDMPYKFEFNSSGECISVGCTSENDVSEIPDQRLEDLEADAHSFAHVVWLANKQNIDAWKA